jgi:hypothetical protein
MPLSLRPMPRQTLRQIRRQIRPPSPLTLLRPKRPLQSDTGMRTAVLAYGRQDSIQAKKAPFLRRGAFFAFYASERLPTAPLRTASSRAKVSAGV